MRDVDESEFIDTNLIEYHGKGTSRKAIRIRERRLRMFKEQEGACWWCRDPMSLEPLRITWKGNVKHNSSFASFEHIIPKGMGGARNKQNTVLAHASCNRNRHRRKWSHDPIYGNKNSV